MASYSDILFGRIVLKNRLVPQAMVTDCLQRKPPGQSLGEALVARRALTAEQAQQVQRAQALMQFVRAERTFARIVHQRRLVDLPTLRRCFQVQEQERHRVRIGQLLMDMRLLTPEQNEAVVDEQLVLIAEETARIEEQGLAGSLVESVGYTPTDDLARADAAEDLDSSTMKRAVGPRGLFDAPSPELVRRTMPMMRAVQLEEEEEPAPIERTLELDAPIGLQGPPSRHQAPVDEVAGEGLIGKTIASRYRIHSKVGEGGMGTVYKAEHCLMEKIVALKVLNPNLVTSKASLEQFRQEIRAASRFQHKNVVQIYDAGEGEGGIFYMAMEFAEGETLEDIIQRAGALPVEQALRYFRQTLRAVGEAHKKGIIHRDLKSGNLMITQDKGGEQLVKVMDFGIAKIAFDEQEAPREGLYRTQEGIVTGTPQYMSPEQASGERVDHRSDLYSLGVILFEMLTGELPFKSNTPMGYLGKHIVEPPPRLGEVKQGLPLALEEITLRLLEKKPDDRYPSAEDVLEDLEVRCSGEGLRVLASAAVAASAARAPAMTVAVQAPLEPVSPAAPGRAAAPARRPWGLIVGLVALLLVVSGSTTLAIYLSRQGDGHGSGPEVRPSPEQRLAEARRLLDAGELAAAVTALEELTSSADPPAEAAGLLEDTRKRLADLELAADLAREGDELAAQFRSGASGEQAAREALQRYEHSLSLREDGGVRERLGALRARLEAGAQQTEASQAREGMARVLEASDAIQRGELTEAAEKLGQAQMLLPPDDEALGRLKRHLEAARLLAAAKQARAEGDLDAARRDLSKAAPLHPDAQVKAWIAKELATIEAELGQREQRAAVGQLLVRALEAAVKLDLEDAQAAAEQAAKTASELGVEVPGLAGRARALEKLGGFAPELARVGDALAELEGARAGARPEDGRKLVERLRALREQVAALAEDDAELTKLLNERLERQLGRAGELTTELEQRREQSKSLQLQRFERRLAQLRALPAERETKAAVAERLAGVLDLQESPSYVRGECSAEDRAWVDEQVRLFMERRAVWTDLTPEDALASEMIYVPGGRWTSPSGQEHDLPQVYYVGVNEVTCAEWARFLAAAGGEPPAGFPGPTDQPVTSISLADARRYCRWRSQRRDGTPRRVQFRVPTEAEWERAVRGDGGGEFPWGEDFADWREGYAAVSGKVAQVGSFQKDRTAWGLVDVVGNVREMTTLPGRDAQVVLRGGSASSERATCGASWRQELKPGLEVSSYVGLRLVAVGR